MKRINQKLIKITEGKDLISPWSLYWEVGNTISAMFEKKKIDLNADKEAIEYCKMIPIKLVDVDIKKSIEFLHQYKIREWRNYRHTQRSKK